jgi:outer membrane lipase/esterase
MTTAGQKIQADYFYSLVVAPSQISFLAEVPVKTRTAVIDGILNQIPISQSQRGASGYNGWITGDVSRLKMDNYQGFPGDPGTPAAVSAGLDYKVSPYWLVGGALSVGYTRQSYSTVGHFTQNEVAASIYAAYRNGPSWAVVVGTAGFLHDHVNRAVPIGITVQPNNGTVNGTNLSLAGETGYNIGTGQFTHGPLVGMVLQRVHVLGFTESGSFTSLSFDDQERYSAVSRIGYQVNFDAGAFRPFAKAVWNHEFINGERLVTAYLTTITAPGFSMPAVVLGKDWGAVSAGTTIKLSSTVTGLLAFVGTFAQDNVTNYGVQFGLNVALGEPPRTGMPVKAPHL